MRHFLRCIGPAWRWMLFGGSWPRMFLFPALGLIALCFSLLTLWRSPHDWFNWVIVALVLGAYGAAMPVFMYLNWKHDRQVERDAIASATKPSEN